MAVADARFRTLHALRIKGFAKAEAISEVAGLAQAEVERHLGSLRADELVAFREARALWQLTPTGLDAHRAALALDATNEICDRIGELYSGFLGLNVEFKGLCGDWQLVDGDPSRVNDHSDPSYDAKIIDRLLAFDATSRAVVTGIGGVHGRLSPYAPRLGASLERLKAGETNMFTGVMCGSYHDVWMELHEDLILTLGIDRVAEGSF